MLVQRCLCECARDITLVQICWIGKKNLEFFTSANKITIFVITFFYEFTTFSQLITVKHLNNYNKNCTNYYVTRFFVPFKVSAISYFPTLNYQSHLKACGLKPIGSSLCPKQFKQSWESVLSLWRERACPLLSKGKETDVVRQRTS